MQVTKDLKAGEKVFLLNFPELSDGGTSFKRVPSQLWCLFQTKTKSGTYNYYCYDYFTGIIVVC